MKVNYIFNNVLVTSFPTTLSNTDETTFEFEVSIQKDNNGRFFEVQKLLNNYLRKGDFCNETKRFNENDYKMM